MTVKQKCECEQICMHYGIESQKGILAEECADVMIMIQQIMQHYFRNEAEQRLQYYIKEKLEWQIKRIESEG